MDFLVGKLKNNMKNIIINQFINYQLLGNFMDSLVIETISSLKLISEIKKGYKLNTVTLQIQPISIFTSLGTFIYIHTYINKKFKIYIPYNKGRFFLYNDDRNKTVHFFVKTIKNAIYIIGLYLKILCNIIY